MAIRGDRKGGMREETVLERRRRRAHWRWQRHGPDRCMRKRVRIEESFALVRVRSCVNLELPF